MEQNYKSVVFCGYPASGKTTIAKRIAEIFNLEYVCAGDVLKKMIKGKSSDDKDFQSESFWETDEGFAFFKKREKDDSFDRKLDKEMLELVKEKPVALTSWTLPYLNCEAFKIFLKLSKEERIKRMAGRDSISIEEAEEAISIRDEKNILHYKKIYGFVLGDEEPFDMVLDCENKTEDEEVKIIRDFLVSKGFSASR